MKCGKSKMKSTNSHMKSKIVEMKNEAMKKFVYGVCECVLKMALAKTNK